jgi:hypothetical protein
MSGSKSPFAFAARLLASATLAAVALGATSARAQIEPNPPPPSIGSDIPATYFGPAPSSVDKFLVGPLQLLTAGKVDLNAVTVTLPLYTGQLEDGRKVWSIFTDTDDAANAEALGLNFSSKLTYAALCGTARHAVAELDGSLTFDVGAVDFSPERTITAGSPSAFPPKVANPGSVGDKNYTPLVVIANAGNHVYNAPMVAFDVSAEELNKSCDGNADHSKVHDKVVKICPRDGTVTLALTVGFSFSRPVLYLSTEANDAVVAALEGATLAPGLVNIPVGRDDSALSPVERIFVHTNGPTNVNGEVNPQRQGLNSAITDGRGPLNVLGGIPTIATDYSPIWDVNLGEWTQEAIDKGYRSRMTDEFQILGMVVRGFLTGPGGKPYGSTGFVVNCPIVQRLL